MDARRFAHLILLSLAVAIGGCQAPQPDPSGSVFPLPPVAASSAAAPSSGSSVGDLGSDSRVSRAVSDEEPESAVASSLQQSKPIAPGEVPTLPLNPVFDLLNGTANSSTQDEAYQTLGLMGLSGMARVMHGIGNTGSRRGFHQVADVTDDILQPDEEAQRGRRPPYAFGLEWKY
jgi:hypothetical protein